MSTSYKAGGSMHEVRGKNAGGTRYRAGGTRYNAGGTGYKVGFEATLFSGDEHFLTLQAVLLRICIIPVCTEVMQVCTENALRNHGMLQHFVGIYYLAVYLFKVVLS